MPVAGTDEEVRAWQQRTTSRIRKVTSPEVPEPAPGTWSNCLVVNGVAYVAGMIARGKDGKIVDGDEYEQAKAIFAKIRHLIEAAGGSMADVVKVSIFVTDIKQREKVWRARREVFSGDFPASTLVAGRGAGRAVRQGRDRGHRPPRRRRALNGVAARPCPTRNP